MFLCVSVSRGRRTRLPDAEVGGCAGAEAEDTRCANGVPRAAHPHRLAGRHGARAAGGLHHAGLALLLQRSKANADTLVTQVRAAQADVLRAAHATLQARST